MAVEDKTLESGNPPVDEARKIDQALVPESKESNTVDDHVYPTSFRKIALITSALYLSMFLVALVGRQFPVRQLHLSMQVYTCSSYLFQC